MEGDLHFIKTPIVSRLDGKTATAYVASCGECDNQTFLVYLVDPGKLQHLQCEQCGITYCAGHDCATLDMEIH
jgi:hypothetical protein